ncbi:MAG: hypothetical protein HY905_16105 [Deltaproteobacteria bacterium]|nr:hypothetical protein [Deltaproteobacteria bacterium]
MAEGDVLGDQVPRPRDRQPDRSRRVPDDAEHGPAPYHGPGRKGARFCDGRRFWQGQDLEGSFLYKSIHAYLLVGLAAENVPAGALPELSLNKWEALWPLEENPAALARVGAWAAAERVPVATVAEIAALVAPYVARGGSLDDLLAGSARRPPDTPYRRIRRLLGVVRSLLAERPVSPAARPRLLAALDGCLAAP